MPQKNGPPQGRSVFWSYNPDTAAIEPLNHSHQRSDFDCGKEPPNLYIRHMATVQPYDNLRNYVLRPCSESSLVAAYYAACPDPVLIDNGLDQLEPDDLESVMEEEPLLVRLRWLATDVQYARQGIGKLLVFRLLREVNNLSARHPIAGLILTPLDAEAKGWYLRLDYGFVEVPDSFDLFLPLAIIRQLFP